MNKIINSTLGSNFRVAKEILNKVRMERLKNNNKEFLEIELEYIKVVIEENLNKLPKETYVKILTLGGVGLTELVLKELGLSTNGKNDRQVKKLYKSLGSTYYNLYRSLKEYNMLNKECNNGKAI